MTQKDKIIWAEMARRKKQFHPTENWQDIKLWGLFRWGTVSHLLKKGLLLAPGYTSTNKTIWVRPSEEAYNEFIKPLLSYDLETLTRWAGWND